MQGRRYGIIRVDRNVEMSAKSKHFQATENAHVAVIHLKAAYPDTVEPEELDRSLVGLVQDLPEPNVVIDLSGVQKRFDGNTEAHYHVRCAQCGRIDDVHVEVSAELDRVSREVSDYEITGHRLEFTGICPSCRGKARRRRADK